MMGTTLRALALSAALALTVALAQPLTRLAPADTVLALSFGGGFEVSENLLAELATLDWARAGETLNRLGVSLDQGLGTDSLEPALAGLTELCPALAQEEVALFGEETLLAVSVSPFNPLPAVSAMTRFGEAQGAAELEALILACLPGEVLTLEESGVPLYVIGDGSAFPVVIATLDTLFLASSNPESLRGMVRRARGAEEPSLADSPLAEVIGEAGVGLGLNFAGLAEVLQNFAGVLMADPETERLVPRALAFLRTLSGYAVSVSATPEGLVIESLTMVDPDGGDEALAQLFLCERCELAAEIAVPEGSTGVSGRHISFGGMAGYLQGWLDDVSPGLDLRAVLREQGLDLDVLLLDWIGEEVYTVRLAPVSSDLASLLYLPPQVLLAEARGEEAARAGIEAFADRLPELLAGLSDDATRGLLTEPVVDGYDYRGVAIDRYRFGPNTNLGVTYLGDFLLVGTPSYALEPFIDAAFDSPTAHPGYQAARAAAPERIVGFRYGDDHATALDLADLGSLLSQPLAFFLAAGLQAGTFTDEFEVFGDFGEMDVGAMDEGSFWGHADLSGVTASPLAVPSSLSGTLVDTGENIVYYALGGLSPGETVALDLRSDDFDTFLYLVDGGEGMILYENDDYQGSTSRSRIVFVAEEGIDYWAGVSSYGHFGSGSYSLSFEPVAEEPDDLESFFAWPTDPEGREALLLELGETLEGTLGRESWARVADYYALHELAPGERVTVTLQSLDFDTYLRLIDAESSVILDENDDFPDTTQSQLEFRVQDGVSYLVEVTSFGGGSVGDYTLILSSEAPVAPALPGEPEVAVAEPPGFAELLQLTDILPQALFILSDRLSYSEGYSEVRPEGLYSRTVFHIAW